MQVIDYTGKYIGDLHVICRHPVNPETFGGPPRNNRLETDVVNTATVAITYWSCPKD
jgi:hypothetical protein